jgi:hypothetical protein
MPQENLLAPQDSPVEDNKNYLTELVGEQKKFKTPEDLAKGKYEADLYIKTLEKNFDDLRKDYVKVQENASTTAKLEELIRQMEAKSKQNTTHEQPPVNDVKPAQLDPNELKSLVSNAVQEMKISDKQQENFNLVKTKLKEQFGDKYQEVLKQRITELELTDDDINTLAKKSPTAFFKTIGLEEKRQGDQYQAPPPNVNRFTPQGKQKRTWSYYKGLKEKNPNILLDPKINVQMHNDVLELGETAFYDVD